LEDQRKIMAYTRYTESGHYIYGGADYVDFDGVAVPDDEVDVFIYTLFGITGTMMIFGNGITTVNESSIIIRRDSAFKNCGSMLLI